MGQQVDTSRGTAVWAMNQLRQDALTSFLDDLVDKEESGLSPHECDQVKKALARLANRAAEVPDGSFFRGSILGSIEEFARIYEEWNSHEGPGRSKAEMRRSALRRLRKCRQRIAKIVRANQYILAKELDNKLVNDMYGALGGLASALPSLFSNLGQAASRFIARQGG